MSVARDSRAGCVGGLPQEEAPGQGCSWVEGEG